MKEGWLTKLPSPDRGRHAPLVPWAAYGEETSHHALRNRLSLSSYIMYFMTWALLCSQTGQIKLADGDFHKTRIGRSIK